MSNTLHGAQGGVWKGDGSEGSVLTVDGASLSLKSAKTGSPFNVMYEVPNGTRSDYYFEVSIVHKEGRSSSLSVGVVCLEEFAPSYRIKGMFYNGNLTNGSAALKVGWGPGFGSAGDTVGVRVMTQNGEVKVAFYKNNVCLGTGFCLSDENRSYYPCLHVNGGPIQLSIAVPESLPPSMTSEVAAPPKGYDGDWKLVEASSGEQDPLPLPQGGKGILVTLTKETERTCTLSMHIANRLSSRISIIENGLEGDKIKVGPVASTMMMPPPELRPIEDFIRSKLETLDEMALRDNQLVFRGPSSVKLVFERHERVAETLDKY